MFTFDFILYLKHIFLSIFNRKKEIPFTPVRLFFLFAALIPAHLFQFAVRIGFILDNIFFPSVRKKKVNSPVFIIGNFRSGSTFLHRLLNKDSLNFTAFKTWEIYFAPSLVQKKLFRWYFSFDRIFGSPVYKLIKLYERRSLKKVKVHHMGFNEPEEDEGLMVYTWDSLLMWFVFPFMDVNPPLHKFDTELSQKKKKGLMDFYDICVRRHLSFQNDDRMLLSKNPSFSGKIKSILEKYPDAKFIYLARTPYEVLPSIMNWFSMAWNFFVEKGKRYPYKEYVIEMLRHWYTYAPDVLETLPENQQIIVNYSDFIKEPEQTVRKIYSRLELDLGKEYADHLAEFTRTKKEYKSPNYLSLSKDGFTTEFVYETFADVFDRFGFEKRYNPHYDNVE